MQVRSFLAPDGHRWRVWLVEPRGRPGERRHAPDRRRTPVEEVLDPPVIERRRGQDRRTGDGRAPRTAPLPEPWRSGWLVFELDGAPERSDQEARRRLAPVPDCWRECADAELASLWRRAEPSSRVA
jgi:hypothetical protein